MKHYLTLKQKSCYETLFYAKISYKMLRKRAPGAGERIHVICPFHSVSVICLPIDGNARHYAHLLYLKLIINCSLSSRLPVLYISSANKQYSSSFPQILL